MTESERRDYWREQGVGSRPLVHGVLWCGGAVLILAVACYAAFWVPYRQPDEVQPYPIPLLPVPPRAEPEPEAAASAGYEWVDRPAGIGRIPLDDAMLLTSERLVVRKKE